MAYNGVQIDNSPNIIVITDSDANQITVTQPITRTVEVAALGPQGPVGLQGPTGSMAESNSGSFSITGSLTVSGSSTFTNIGPAIFSGSVNISGSAFYNGKEILTTTISGGFVTTSSFNAFTSSINAFTASYNTGSFTGSFTGVANLTSFSASSAFVTGNVTVLGTASINTLIVNQTQLSTGSNQLGDAADDTQTLFGTVRIPTGSLTVSGSSFFSGSVGIGTGTPLRQLHVIGDIEVTNGIYGDATDHTFYTIASSSFHHRFYTRTSGGTSLERFTIQGGADTGSAFFQNTNVGIGTTTPGVALDVIGSMRSSNSVFTSELAAQSLRINTANQFIFRNTGSVEIARFDNVGNWGFGIASPQARVHISSSATSTPTLLVGRANGQPSIKASSDANGNYLSLDSNGSATIINHYVADNIWLASGGGSVAVGHSSPQARLHVKGTGATNATYGLLVRNSNDSSSLAVLDDGNVGIGGVIPSGRLHVYEFGLSSYKTYTTTNAGVIINSYQSQGNPYTKTTDIVAASDATVPSEIRLFTRTSGSVLIDERLRINSSGNVGIGTSTPGNLLSVAGAVSASTFNANFAVVTTRNSKADFYGFTGPTLSYFNGVSIVPALTVIDTGNIGIGTATPQRRLHVDTSGSGVTETQLALTSTDVNNRVGILFASSSLSAGRQHKFLHRSNGALVEWLLGTNAGETAVWKFQSRDDSNYSLNINVPYNTGTTSITTGVSQSILAIGAGISNQPLNISASGNVGIGTTSTPFKFNVVDSGLTYVAQFRGNNSTYIISGDTSLAGESGLNARNSVGQLFLGIGPGGDAYFTGTSGATALNFSVANVNAIWVNSSRNVGIGTSGSVSARLHVSGSSGSALLRVDSDASSNIIFVSGSGNVGIGTSTPGQMLTVVGNGQFGLNLAAAGARLHTRGAGTTNTSTSFRAENANQFPALRITDDLSARFDGKVSIGSGLFPTASLEVSGTTFLSGSAGTGSALTVYKSGSTVMSIQGSQGELFSITDSLSGSLFSVSNISGLPILEVFSDNTVLLGSYLDPMLITTQRLTANSGSTVIYSLPTASYDGVFVDYVIRSGSNARAGQFMGMWSGSSTNFTDNSTTDFGDTTGFIFGLIVSGSNMVLTGSASTSAWTVRAGIRSI